jgi:AcrR family transcriptional regulator
MSRWVAREHSEQTRAALRAAAERLVAEGGPAALSVRAVAREAGTTTRAVYSLFGSKEALLVDALARDAFEFLYEEIDALPETDDPVADLIAVGVSAFRRLVLEHPAAYRIAFQRVVPSLDPGPELTDARSRAVEPATGEGPAVESKPPWRTIRSGGGCGFNAMLEGLANAELRGSVFRNLPEGDEATAWHDTGNGHRRLRWREV